MQIIIRSTQHARPRKSVAVNIDPIYWTLYAVRKRSGLANNGYPKQVPWYTPPKLGDVMSDPGEVITEEDWVVAESIERCVNEIRAKNVAYAESLDIWEGAYEGAPASRRQRCRDWGVRYEACKKAANRCKREVERLMYG